MTKSCCAKKYFIVANANVEIELLKNLLNISKLKSACFNDFTIREHFPLSPVFENN